MRPVDIRGKQNEAKVPVDRIRELLSYDPATGVLTWKVSRGRVRAGSIAGCIKPEGYISVGLLGMLFYAHRLAWAIYTGEWPENQIDHINKNTSDNRIVNLRDVTNQDNHKNLGLRSDNSSGVTGVIWFDRCNKWKAGIYADGRFISRGYFDNFEDAVAARKDAEIKYGYSPTHGLPNQAIK